MIVSAAFGWGIIVLIIAITCSSALIYAVSKGLESKKSLNDVLKMNRLNKINLK